MGLAFAWGTPSNMDYGDLLPDENWKPSGQGVVELFYRYRLTPFVQLTPDLQLLINPSFDPDRELIAVFGVRARVAW